MRAKHLAFGGQFSIAFFCEGVFGVKSHDGVLTTTSCGEMKCDPPNAVLMQFHPDKNLGKSEEFVKIQEAEPRLIGESESGRVPDDSREWCLDGLAPETVDSELALDLAVGDAVGATAFCLDAVLCGRQFDWQHKGMKQKVFRRNGGYWLPLFSRLSAGGGCFGGVYIIYTRVLGIYKSMAKLTLRIFRERLCYMIPERFLQLQV